MNTAAKVGAVVALVGGVEFWHSWWSYTRVDWAPVQASLGGSGATAEFVADRDGAYEIGLEFARGAASAVSVRARGPAPLDGEVVTWTVTTSGVLVASGALEDRGWLGSERVIGRFDARADHNYTVVVTTSAGAPPRPEKLIVRVNLHDFDNAWHWNAIRQLRGGALVLLGVASAFVGWLSSGWRERSGAAADGA